MLKLHANSILQSFEYFCCQISSISIHIISIHTVSKLGHFLRHSVDYESVMVDGYQAAVHIWTTRQVHQWPVVSRTADLYTWDRCSAVTVDAASTWQTGPGRRSVSVDSARQDCDRHPHVSTPLHLCSSVPECLTHHDTALTTTTRCSRKKKSIWQLQFKTSQYGNCIPAIWLQKIENWRRPTGRPHTTWMKTIQQDQ